MKRFVCLLPAMLLCLLTLAGCGCRHQWEDADCVVPSTCALCGETQGEALGHRWADATCVTARNCAACGETEGEPLGHSWNDATCTEPRTCTLCAETEGEPLEHSFGEFTFENGSFRGSCTVCAGDLTLEPEAYALRLMAGTWNAWLYFDNGVDDPDSGHTMTFAPDGTGVLALPSRSIWYPETVRLRFLGFNYLELMHAYSADFYLDGYELEEGDAFDYEQITQLNQGLQLRLFIPTEESHFTDPSVAMFYPAYNAQWEFKR